MPEFFRSTAKKPGATKVRKGYKSGDWIQGAIKRPGAFTKNVKRQRWLWLMRSICMRLRGPEVRKLTRANF